MPSHTEPTQVQCHASTRLSRNSDRETIGGSANSEPSVRQCMGGASPLTCVRAGHLVVRI